MQTPPVATATRGQRQSPSLRLFRMFLDRDDTGEIKSERIISRDCYLAWLKARGAMETDVEAQRFRRILTNHVAGTDGRCPFDLLEEASILRTLRKRESWPCFPARLAYIGKRYRSKGYHEKLGDQNEGKSTMTTSDLDMDSTVINIHQLLHQLNAQDASYLTQLSGHLAGRFVNGLTAEDQQTVHDIVRYMIFGRTLRCSKENLAFCDAAHTLCDLYSTHNSTIVMVFDATAKSLTECCLAQNKISLAVLGSAENKCLFSMCQNKDLFRLLLAVGGAYHCPGVGFTLHKQELICIHDDDKGSAPQRKAFDLTYLVDLATFYIVVFGKETVG